MLGKCDLNNNAITGICCCSNSTKNSIVGCEAESLIRGAGKPSHVNYSSINVKSSPNLSSSILANSENFNP